MNESVSTDDLRDFFEREDFRVHLFEQDGMQCAELETWTDGGVNMIITLMPFTKEKFVSYVIDFDIDEEIDTHRQDSRYKQAFKLADSLNDFNSFKERLDDVVKKLRKF